MAPPLPPSLRSGRIPFLPQLRRDRSACGPADIPFLPQLRRDRSACGPAAIPFLPQLRRDRSACGPAAIPFLPQLRRDRSAGHACEFVVERRAGAGKALPEGLGCQAADAGRLGRRQAFDADKQQRLAVIRRQPGQRPLDAAPEFARRGFLEGGRPRRAARPEADQRIGCRVADGARAAVAVVEIARHGEEPGAETRVRPKAGSGFHQTQPGVLGQILGHLAAARQPCEKGKDPRAVGLVDGVERGGIAVAKPVDERELGVSLHDRHNAPSARA